MRFRLAQGRQDSLGNWPQLLLLPPPLDSARLSSCACPAWLPLRFPRLFFFLGCAASPGAVPAVAAPPGSCCFRPSGCSHADAAATAASPCGVASSDAALSSPPPP